jgi:BlaI family transcriptional regulator, penicillinase repressor
MARPTSKQPTDGELEILKILWESGPAELGGICSALRRHRPVATTTVATMLKIMLSKGLVKRSEGDRASLWSAKVSQRAATTGMLRKLLDRVFDGSAQRLVAHLLEEGRLSDQDRHEIQRLLDSSATGKKL